MEREMEQMGMNESARQMLRERWRKTETEYLREQRKKVHVSAFKELKTIGHGKLLIPSLCTPYPLLRRMMAAGAFGVVSLVKEKSTGQLFAMKQARPIRPDELLVNDADDTCIDLSCERWICFARVKKVTFELRERFSKRLPLSPHPTLRSG